MAKFMVIYTGGTGMAATPEEQQQIMAEWGAWYGKMGPSIVDGGSPFGASNHITSDGTQSGPLSQPAVTGYTIIESDSLESATAACADHPHLNHQGQVQVFATIDMGGGQ